MLRESCFNIGDYSDEHHHNYYYDSLYELAMHIYSLNHRRRKMLEGEDPEEVGHDHVRTKRVRVATYCIKCKSRYRALETVLNEKLR